MEEWEKGGRECGRRKGGREGGREEEKKDDASQLTQAFHSIETQTSLHVL